MKTSYYWLGVQLDIVCRYQPVVYDYKNDLSLTTCWHGMRMLLDIR